MVGTIIAILVGYLVLGLSAVGLLQLAGVDLHAPPTRVLPRWAQGAALILMAPAALPGGASRLRNHR